MACRGWVPGWAVQDLAVEEPVVEEVIPETQRDKYTDVAVLGFIGGFLVMMILDVALG